MYQIINNLPIDYNFQSKTKDELKLYGIWFKENKDIRLNYLIELVKSTPNYQDWKADFSISSLKELGKWLKENIETETLSAEEYKLRKSKVPEWIDVLNWDLTIKTRSILVDAGIYFGEAFVKTHKKYKWEQYFSKIKKDVNNGHVVIKFKFKELNPILIMINIGLGLVDNTKDENCLYDLFKVWEEYI